MSSLAHVSHVLASPPAPSYLPFNPRRLPNYCLWCHSVLEHPPLQAVPTPERLCFLPALEQETHARICNECALLMAQLWHWPSPIPNQAGRHAIHPRDAAVYVCIERDMRKPGQFTSIFPAHYAREIGSELGLVTYSIKRLRQRGLLERKQDTAGRFGYVYRCLIWQLPRGE